jgi:hypothetical protein
MAPVFTEPLTGLASPSLVVVNSLTAASSSANLGSSESPANRTPALKQRFYEASVRLFDRRNQPGNTHR